jgi:hypothetical protein
MKAMIIYFLRGCTPLGRFAKTPPDPVAERPMSNKSLDAETQPLDAASPQVLGSGQLRR